MPQRVLALEIAAHELKAAVVETGFRDYRVVGFYREPITADGGGMAEQLRHFVAQHHLAATTVLSSLPGDRVSWRTFFLPFRDRKRLDQTVPFELETQVAFGLDDIVIDYHVLDRDKAGTTVLAALVQRKDLEEHLGVLTAAGLDPKVVDLAPLATLNVLNLLGNDLPPTFAYVGGTLGRAVVALYRNRQLVGLRTLVSAQPVDAAEAAAAAANNGHADGDGARAAALVGEIRWTLLALNGAPLDEGMPCLLAGEGVEFDPVAQQIAAGLGLEVRRLDQAPLRNLSAALRGELPSFVSPLGLALREVAPSGALGVNFRQGEFAYHRGQDEIRRALWLTGFFALVASALLITNTYMSYQQQAARLGAIQAQIRQVFTQTLPDVHRIVDERKQLQDEVDAEQKKLQLLGGISASGGVTALDAMRTIAVSLPETLKLDIDEYVMDAESIRIKAETDSFETVDAIKQHIAGAQYFGDVQVKDVRATPDGQKVDFRLILSFIKESAAAPAPAEKLAIPPAGAPPPPSSRP